ncbi:ETC complex I subunit conserved region-domain-containing protein [Dendryphion nanum]|uniref:ETC complex I subunit conserved region-domain-containing protein n=1 Tax=Dendryphion nanum TaxID=256645 RepID=A0A9P9DIG9_9PLEO|nr:ETC complex I subunit conserved region-domain-containing protein [Dendryphion nanum]
MRAAVRLLASVKPGQFLEAGTPTGLTGLVTHPSPRSTLLYLYSSTLDKLSQIPESSVYRQSTEALTKHRLNIIKAAQPPGLKEWQERLAAQVAETPNAFKQKTTSLGVNTFVPKPRTPDERSKAAEWDGEVASKFPEGIRTNKERKSHYANIAGTPEYSTDFAFKEPVLDHEPQLTAEQISEVENQIGAGLIEEVIQVAEGEHGLVDEMIKSKGWEALEEPAPEGQWSYHERVNTHTNTQKP